MKGVHPVRVNNSAHEAANVIIGGSIELDVGMSSPGAVGIAVNVVDVLIKVDRSLTKKIRCNRSLLTKSESLARLLRLRKIYFLFVGEG